MGLGLDLLVALVAFVIARIVPPGRPRRWIGELIASIAGALGAGTLATALDFGGWREMEWRSAVLGFVTALLLLGVIRVTLLLRKPNNTSGEGRP